MTDFYTHLQCFSGDCRDRRLSLPPELGEGYLRCINPRTGMKLLLENYRLDKDIRVATNDASFPLGLSFCISGAIQWSVDGSREQYRAEGGYCELLCSGCSESNALYLSGEPIVMVNIMFSPELVQSFFDDSSSSRHGGRVLCLTGGGKALYAKNPMPDSVLHVLRQLLNAPCENLADALYIQGKVLELTAFQWRFIDVQGPEDACLSCSGREPVLISEAKQILKANMQSPPTIRGLARMLGTNETKLKRSFATHCATTVHGFLTSTRMERACELLARESLTMSHIAAELGFSERTHFSRAFTGYFGMSPSAYRSKRNPDFAMPAKKTGSAT